ncbi:hypothetical protein QL093DRAFT_2369393 [Fusarium oxysporum]|nr:hypothetical protein QL093DRAFT_2369393 [Fusarium oxysporum]
MLRDTGGKTVLTFPRSQPRRGDILYGEMYSFNEEIIDDACRFLLQNPDLQHLTLGPLLCNGVQSISCKPTSGKSIIY